MFRWLGFAVLVACGTPDAQDSGVSELDLDAVESSERPSQRSEIYGIADALSNSILVFGGNEGPIVNQSPKAAFLEETWLFEPGFGWTEVEGVGPSARGRYGAAYDAAGRRALIFGGRYRDEGASGDYTLFRELWAFDFVSREWSLLSEKQGPKKRTYPSMFWDDQEQALYLFGGMTNKSPMVIEVAEDLWRYKDGQWEELEMGGDVPSTRTFLGEAWDPNRREMILFGGQIGNYWDLAYNETYALNIDSLEWTRLNKGNKNSPSTRMHAQLTYDPVAERVLLFGGHTDIGDANDLWELDSETGKWSLLREADGFTGEPLGCMDNASEVPANYVDQDLTAPERRHRGMFTALHNSLWIFGGMHAECSDHLDDTWRFGLDGDDWVELLEARTGESCARQAADCECLCY
ncbi:MAG: kelch repeat-containing protein [Myxococcota bacterium]|nr:kelch repeat-containing protein [Myxococcota bacterium]